MDSKSSGLAIILPGRCAFVLLAPTFSSVATSTLNLSTRMSTLESLPSARMPARLESLPSCCVPVTFRRLSSSGLMYSLSINTQCSEPCVSIGARRVLQSCKGENWGWAYNCLQLQSLSLEHRGCETSDGSGCRTSHTDPSTWLPSTRMTRPTHTPAGSSASQEVQLGCSQRLNQPM